VTIPSEVGSFGALRSPKTAAPSRRGAAIGAMVIAFLKGIALDQLIVVNMGRNSLLDSISIFLSRSNY
jgi:hypothetical protein